MRSRPGKVRLKSDVHQLREQGLVLEPDIALRPLNLQEIFGNRRLVEIEIGSGKGAFILRRAAQRPETNLLGVEWVPSYALYVADRVRRAGLTNVRMIAADAATLFKNLPDESVWRVHIYYPDPWPKTRHHRRRLIKPQFLRHVARVLRVGGWLGVVTDHAGYFQQILSTLRQTPGLAETPFPTTADSPAIVDTNFERKYLAKGKTCHAIAALRYGSGS